MLMKTLLALMIAVGFASAVQTYGADTRNEPTPICWPCPD
jgi:hypothetical protein